VAWGVWRIPEDELGALGPLHGARVLEYGCGGGQFGLGLAARGAEVVGIDLSGAQLGHALRLASDRGLRFPVAVADGERLPFGDAAFDVVFCDHGAMSFCDPDHSLPEVARVLRPGGRLVFCVSSRLRFVCCDEAWEPGPALVRDWFGDPRLDDGQSVDFAPSPGEWITRATRSGLAVVALHELRPPTDATSSYPWFVGLDWARRWPAEELWVFERR